MVKSNKSAVKSPGYYVWLRFKRNPIAVSAAVVIVLAHVIAFLGYLIMPDSTPSADDGSPLVKKKPMGFEVTMLKAIKQREVPHVNVISKMFFGQENPYRIEPVEYYSLKGDSVYYTLYGSESDTISKHLLPFIRAVYFGDDKTLCTGRPCAYRRQGNSYEYIALDGTRQTVSYAEAVKEFNALNIERRHYILGTDKSGRDLFSRLLFGARISLLIGMISMVISMFLGITLGAIAGFFGGKTDKFVMWLLTVTWSIPGIMLVIAISLALQSKGIWVAFVAVGLTMWVEVARVVRGQILSVKEKLFIEAAKALGIGNFRIIFRHILPNMFGPIIVIATANYAAAVLIEAGLSFLGLGVQPPMPSWGMMVNEGYNSNWESDGGYMVFLPSLCICLIVLSFNLLGNGLRDAYDPQSKLRW
ncbi:MAG: dppC [Chitinophagaceae bacterium]|nr:dppC [Chitinophagaceae bacterium]